MAIAIAPPVALIEPVKLNRSINRESFGSQEQISPGSNSNLAIFGAKLDDQDSNNLRSSDAKRCNNHESDSSPWRILVD